MSGPARFTIRAASALTGINQNTLRAWERRYGLVRPQRTPKGYRLFSQEDLARLRAVQAALQHGIRVGRVREYIDGTAKPTAAENAAALALEAAPAGERARPPRRSLEDFAVQLEQATARFDRLALERSFNRAVGLYSLRTAFRSILCPALRRISERVPEHPARGAEVHFLQAFATERLAAALVGLRPLHQQVRVLFACPGGERHEIGLMLLALETALEGVSALYLGSDVPADAIRQAALPTCRVVVLSCTVGLPRELVLGLRDQLDAHPRRPHLMLGGPAAVSERAWLESQGLGALPLDHDAAGAMVLEALRRP